MMTKTILVTGATDGIGLETTKMLVASGHTVLLHGRNPTKLKKIEIELNQQRQGGQVESYVADLSNMVEVQKLAKAVAERNSTLDVLINNAGVFNTPNAVTLDHLDVRFAVNTIAPYLLTELLLPVLSSTSRVINLSSAAQAPVNLQAMAGKGKLSDGAAYAQSKLALTMWSRAMALSFGEGGPVIIAVNPKSLLGSKMVQQAYGIQGSDLRVGAEILCQVSLSDEFRSASGQYFDNDIGQFTSPHPDALSAEKCNEVIRTIKEVLTKVLS